MAKTIYLGTCSTCGAEHKREMSRPWIGYDGERAMALTVVHEIPDEKDCEDADEDLLAV